MAAATNDHKLGILKDKHLLFYISGGQRSKTSFTGLNTDCLHGHAPSRGSRMRILCLLDFCSLLELHSLAHGPFRLLQSQQFGISKSLSLSFCWWGGHLALFRLCQVSLCPSLTRIFVITFSTHPEIQDNPPTSILNHLSKVSFAKLITFTGSRD